MCVDDLTSSPLCRMHFKNHSNALPVQCSSVRTERLQGSRLHRRSPSPYTSAAIEPKPPATMTHPPTAAHANAHRPSCIGGKASQRSPSTSRVSASHDEGSAVSTSKPPNTAKRPSLSTHPLPPKRPTLMSGKYLHCQLASLSDPCAGGSSTCAV